MTLASIVLQNGRIFDSRRSTWYTTDLHISQGRILKSAAQNAESGGPKRVIDLNGKLVLPGLVDLDANLRQPGLEHKGTLATELAAAVRGGVTHLCAQPDLRPVNDSSAVTRLIRDLAEECGLARVLPVGAASRGLEGKQLSEMHALRQAGCIAVSEAGTGFADLNVMRRCLQYAHSQRLLVMLQPIERALEAAGCAHEGSVADRLGLPSVPTVAETVAVAQILMLVADTGARVHIGPISSRLSLEMLKTARIQGLPVSSSVALANLMFDHERLEDYDSRFRVRPPLRSRRDREALRQAVLDGHIDAIVSGHRPHDSAALNAPFAEAAAGMSQLQIWLQQLWVLAAGSAEHFAAFIRASSQTPAEIAGLSMEGLETGGMANLSVFDTGGDTRVEASAWRSLGRNTPWWGQSLSGRVCLTMCEGRMVYSDGQI